MFSLGVPGHYLLIPLPPIPISQDSIGRLWPTDLKFKGMNLRSLMSIPSCLMGFLLTKGGASHCAVDTSSASLFSLSSLASSASSVSDRNSLWLETAPHTHSRSHSQQQCLAIIPHDLPLHISDMIHMNWHGATTSVSTTQFLLLSATSSLSLSSTFPSLSSLPASTVLNTKPNSMGMTRLRMRC